MILHYNFNTFLKKYYVDNLLCLQECHMYCIIASVTTNFLMRAIKLTYLIYRTITPPLSVECATAAGDGEML